MSSAAIAAPIQTGAHTDATPVAVMLTNDRQRVDRRVLQESDSLEAAGWKVIILGMPMDPGDEEIDPRVVRVTTGSKSATREARILPIYRWIRRLLPMNVFLMRMMKAFAWRVLVDQENFYIRLYEETLNRISADIFVAHDLPMLPVARRAADRCGAKVIYDSHELYSEQEFTGWEKRRWMEIETKYICHCDRIVTTNPAMVAEFGKRYSVKNVDIVYNAEHILDLSDPQKLFHEIFDLSESDKILLLQGGLTANRHLEVLVACMALVRNPAIHLVVLGDGHLRKRLESIAKKKNIAHRVHFHAAVPQKDLLRYTAAADAGVIPYQATCLNNFVCTPNKMFEYIAAGLPILANNLPEMRKFIAGYGIGLLGDTHNAEAFAHLIDEFFSDPAKLEHWRANAKEARKTVCWEEEGKKVVAIYNDLLAN